MKNKIASLIIILMIVLSICGSYNTAVFADELNMMEDVSLQTEISNEVTDEEVGPVEETQELLFEDSNTDKAEEEASVVSVEDDSAMADELDVDNFYELETDGSVEDPDNIDDIIYNSEASSSYGETADIPETSAGIDDEEADNVSSTEEEGLINSNEEDSINSDEEIETEESEIEGIEEEIEDGTPYVLTAGSSYTSQYVLAYEADGIYNVISDIDGTLVVKELDTLNTTTVDDSLLWTFQETMGADALVSNLGDYLYMDYYGVSVCSWYEYGWYFDGEYLEFTDTYDNIYYLYINGYPVQMYVTEEESISIEALYSSMYSTNYTSAGSMDSIYLAFGSDRHGSSTAISTAMSGMPENVSYVGLIGDLASDASYYSSTILGEVQSIFGSAYLNNSNVDIIYGSHDKYCEDDYGMMNARYASGPVYTGTDSYGNPTFYVYGISYDSMINGGSTASTEAEAFKSWIDYTCTDKSIPIIVLCHVPIHAQRGDNLGAAYWNEALNYAATGFFYNCKRV